MSYGSRLDNIISFLLSFFPPFLQFSLCLYSSSVDLCSIRGINGAVPVAPPNSRFDWLLALCYETSVDLLCTDPRGDTNTGLSGTWPAQQDDHAVQYDCQPAKNNPQDRHHTVILQAGSLLSYTHPLIPDICRATNEPQLTSSCNNSRMELQK